MMERFLAEKLERLSKVENIQERIEDIRNHKIRTSPQKGVAVDIQSSPCKKRK